MMVDTPPLPETAPYLPSQKLACNGELPAAPCYANYDNEANSSSSGLPDAGPSRASLGDLANIASRPMGLPQGEMDPPSSFPKLDPQCDCDIDVSRPMSLITCEADNRHCEIIAESPFTDANLDGQPDGHPLGVKPAMESTCAAGNASLAGQSLLVDTHAGQSENGSMPSPERGRANHQSSCSVSSPIQKSSMARTEQVDTCQLSSEIRFDSSQLVRSNLTLPLHESVMTPDLPDMVSGYPSLLPHGSDSPYRLSDSQPPPEVTALLAIQSSSDVVSPVLARNSPLVPWELPSEIGFFWLGLFRISEVKVETQPGRNTSNTLTVQRAWRFALDWVPGGEDLLLDDEQHDHREWFARIMRPWWEPYDATPDQLVSFESSRLLLPLPLLAPFTENSTATGHFPAGYFCAMCGRVNVQRFLRHRSCESAACTAKIDLRREIGWVIGASSTRDRKVNSATISPDDKWAAPTTAKPAVGFDDGTRLFRYHLASPTSSGISGAGAPVPSSDGCATVDACPVSVRHIFNGNRASLQAGASALFETLQRDVRIERRIGSTGFSTPLFESGDDPVLGPSGRGMWDLQAETIENVLRNYCGDLGTLRVHSLRIHAWTSDGKHRQTFRSRFKYLVLLCLGADISLLSMSPDTNSPRTRQVSKGKETLRVTMVHGDIVVLSGSHIEFLMLRTGMCMLLEAECI
ncbi:hypothetical protein F5148DRAFT_151118 [Russula earlei]|uniref:Uncharacterized protein n=1 Tax=Russula earlei TaxID=71964 RepID=A0ACC0U6C0_9AGAM|nr:hypothetical protein F5148DRAFT_151118 [Russula earlei]